MIGGIRKWRDFRSGSKTVLTAPNRDFRVTPSNGHPLVDPVGPVRANNGSGRFEKDEGEARHSLRDFCICHIEVT